MKENPSPYGRLGMLDEHGHRQFIIPAEVKGYFNSLRKKLHFVLICFFLVLPWISVNGKQLLLINIQERQFHFFGLELFAHDAPLVFFLIMIFAMGLALVTALWGRVWCGWACPQTVFIDSLYRILEIWIEGNYIERRKLRQQAMNFQKFRKVSLKWFLYLIVSSLIAHSFIAYFAGAKELLAMIDGSPKENLSYFLIVTSVTLLLLFNFGWFREQFCVIMCPYGKFQSVLMDSHTVTVMYDDARGEPRKGTNAAGQAQGDCVACNRCVQVCPTKIDIRNGVQMECIGCTACIDACDDIMEKVNKPKGLIRYKAFTNSAISWFRPRVLLYSALLVTSILGFTSILAFSTSIRVEVLRAKNAPYLTRFENEKALVQNQFLLRLENHKEDRKIKVNLDSNVRLIIPENPLVILKDQKRDIPIFVELEQSQLKLGRREVSVILTDSQTEKVLQLKKLTILGPVN